MQCVVRLTGSCSATVKIYNINENCTAPLLTKCAKAMYFTAVSLIQKKKERKKENDVNKLN